MPDRALARDQLLAALDAGLDGTATAVVAPAGYGKSVLVSQWTQRHDRDVAWVTLDEPLDDLHEFLRHVTAAVRSVVPDGLPSTATIADAGVLPAEQVVIATLSNELVELPDRLVVVLDDYHVIGRPGVHRLVSELLVHPPPPVHFVIVSRRDPPLPMGRLRASGRLSELRMAELRFSATESVQMAGLELGRPLTEAEASAVYESTEGWAVGLRLMVQAMRGGSTMGAAHLDRGAQEYLVAEVLDRISPDVLRFLVAASMFDRFSAELCDAVMKVGAATPSMLTGREFIHWLQRENLFLIPLDDEGTWFRFHHLFGSLLSDWRRLHADTLGLREAELHHIAAGLLRDQGLVEEAIRELAFAGDVEELVALASRHGALLMDNDRWGDIRRLLAAVPGDVVDTQPALLVLRAWLVGEHGGRYREMFELLDRAERLLDGAPVSELSRDLRGQIAVMRGTYEQLNAGDFDGAVEAAEEARELLWSTPGHHLSYAYALGTVALANNGRYHDARQLADSVVGDERFVDPALDPMIWTKPFLAWVEGSLDALDRAGNQVLAVGEQYEWGGGIAYGHHYLGVSAYERNDLAAAEEHLSVSVDVQSTIVELLLHTSIALAFTEIAAGRPNDAVRTGEALVQEMLSTRGDYNLPTAEAAMALLEHRTGRRPAALRWAQAADPDPPRHRYMFFDPTLAQIEILLSSEPDIGRGRALLDSALASTYGSFNRPVNVKLLGLAALDDARKGDDARAMRALRTAVERAHEGGMVRSLADLGSELVRLLHRLDVTGPVLDHVGAILQALDSDADGDTEPRASLVTPQVVGEPALTERERDVLVLLAERYSNKEISRELTIAPATVKKHTVTLYQKLNVHGRRHAVSKARALGYLQGG